MTAYTFWCYHRTSKHRLGRAYTIQAPNIDEACRQLEEQKPLAVPFQVAATTDTHYGRAVPFHTLNAART